jgi:hypothetical protein
MKYKKLRSYPQECKKGHAEFLTMLQREDLLDKVFSLIFDDDSQ